MPVKQVLALCILPHFDLHFSINKNLAKGKEGPEVGGRRATWGRHVGHVVLVFTCPYYVLVDKKKHTIT